MEDRTHKDYKEAVETLTRFVSKEAIESLNRTADEERYNDAKLSARKRGAVYNLMSAANGFSSYEEAARVLLELAKKAKK